jgi:hypothetical protein
MIATASLGLSFFFLAIDAQHLGHLFRKVGIALFQVVSHFVRLRDCAIDLNFAVSASPSDNSIARRHAAMTPFTPLILGTRDLYRSRKTQRNPPLMTTFMESVV